MDAAVNVTDILEDPCPSFGSGFNPTPLTDASRSPTRRRLGPIVQLVDGVRPLRRRYAGCVTGLGPSRRFDYVYCQSNGWISAVNWSRPDNAHTADSLSFIRRRRWTRDGLVGWLVGWLAARLDLARTVIYRQMQRLHHVCLCGDERMGWQRFNAVNVDETHYSTTKETLSTVRQAVGAVHRALSSYIQISSDVVRQIAQFSSCSNASWIVRYAKHSHAKHSQLNDVEVDFSRKCDKNSEYLRISLHLAQRGCASLAVQNFSYPESWRFLRSLLSNGRELLDVEHIHIYCSDKELAFISHNGLRVDEDAW
jgi:hypothetical protein